MSHLPRARASACLALAAFVLFACGCAEIGDPGVVVSSSAVPDYTAKKYAGPVPKRETYVFMPGHHFEGSAVDHSLERMSFRQLAETLAVELARQQYFPAKDLAGADLLIVVHWGVTNPKVSTEEMRSQVTTYFDPSMDQTVPFASRLGDPGAFENKTVTETNKEEPSAGDDVKSFYAGLANDDVRQLEFQQTTNLTDVIGGDMANDEAIKLLGYSRHLRRLSELPFASTTEQSLRLDLKTDRYFVVLRAYDLRQKTGLKPRIVWTLHLNMRSPGINFPKAVASMGTVAVNYFGRDLTDVKTIEPKLRDGTVMVGEIKILGEVK